MRNWPVIIQCGIFFAGCLLSPWRLSIEHRHERQPLPLTVPRGVVEDGKDKTQRLALTPASSNLPLTRIKTVCFIHTNQYADVW